MSPDDQHSSNVGHDEADTASFQQFVDSRTETPHNSRTFYLLTLVVGVVVLAVVMYLLLL